MEYFGVSKEKLYIFNKGEDYYAYNTFGAHPCTFRGEKGWRFLVYAPHAKNVYLVSNTIGWDEGIKMQPLENFGCFILFVPGLQEGEVYKYKIETSNGQFIYKADPYAFYAEVRPNTASRLYDLKGFTWEDAEFLQKRSTLNHLKQAKNIYEVHLGSWKQHEIENRNKDLKETPIEAFYSYTELKDSLIPYAKQMGYTHLEIMPLHEHPFDGSWGYQPTSYYAITSRYGNPKEFMEFVNEAHKQGLFIILDWVPAHFCKDDHGLRLFDGEKLYEEKEHMHWGTLTFNYAKNEVRTFLNSNALFFLKEFHIDGLRVDGVSSMLYMNYGVDDPKQKKFNKYGGEGDLEAIEFLKHINDLIHKEFPGVITIAEESTSWPKVTSNDDDGLHFDYKWDMGWMHDTLNYCKTDFPYRDKNHNMLSFSTMYASSEHFILPLSHDEVVHGKCSLIVKQPGDYFRQFAGLRLLYLYQITHTGGKLNFMGNELAEFIEWRFYEGLEWFLLDYDAHKAHNEFVKELNHFYLEHKELYEDDYYANGFKWIDANNSEQRIYIYERMCESNNEASTIVLNMDPKSYPKFKIGVKEKGEYEIVFDSDNVSFGGSGYTQNKKHFIAKKAPMHNMPYSIEIRLPGLAGVIIKKSKNKKGK